MTGPTHERDLELAQLLGRIDGASDDAAFDAASELEQLSELQLQELCGATDCLRILDRMRSVEQASTMKEQGSATRRGDDLAPHDRLRLADGVNGLQGALGRFQLQKKIGSGGFADVYLAFDPVLDRNVALKVPRSSLVADDEALKRFLREGKAAATLAHPAIVPVFEAGREGSYHYIAMAWCDGPSLAQVIADRDTAFEERQAASVICQLAKALSHAHLRGIVHRDVKPGNVLIEWPAKEAGPLAPNARLSDFGLVKYSQEGINEITTEGAVLGTPAYMSPEQAAGTSDIGPKTDIFSLGTILYQLLTGHLPHQFPTPWQTLQSVACDLPKSPRAYRPNLSRDLEAITMKCLEKCPEARYPTAFSLVEDLEAWMEGRAIKARTPTWVEIFVRSCRRNPRFCYCDRICQRLNGVGIGALGLE